MPLTVCPFSNLELAVVDRLGDHNLKRLVDHGLLVTVNSNDPAYFGGYVADNYLGVATALQLSKDDLVTLAQNSFHAAFVTADQRAEFLAEVEAYVETAP